MVLTTTLDRTVDGSSTNGTVLGTSAVSARACVEAGVKTRAMTGAMTGDVTGVADCQQLVDHRITAELRASSFTGGRVWLRPTTLDVIATTTPGHLAWSPPT